ncbi:hypothetical protein [Haloarchaeobius litoreus]|uniref:Uncharacterized protein n=1 Tax=Haloarchaeobius litoreus TaxID=755306 RepID=A0ABD6DL73_9EURY|nr:hypothetical protein [Haloarchaeobius litoreus]
MTDGRETENQAMSDALEFYHNLIEKRESAREMFEFDWCLTIRKAGKMYRDGESTRNIAEELDIDRDKAEEAMTVSHLIYRDPPDDVSSRGLLAGYRFFVDNYDVEDLAADSERAAEKYKEDIQEFVGSVYQKHDVEQTDPGPPSDEYKGKSPSQVAWKTILQSDVPSALDEIVEATRVSPVELDIDFAPLIRALEKYEDEVNQALQQSIQNFDPPDSYDPDQTVVDQFAKQTGKRSLRKFIQELEELNDEPIQGFLERLHRGLGAYESGDYLLACFVFISVQDGLMTTLCIRRDEMKRGKDGYFTPQQRKTALENSYEELDREFRDLETDEVIPHLDDFLDHRDHIMHGHLDSFFDENIATIALLFLVFTLFTVLEWSNE